MNEKAADGVREFVKKKKEKKIGYESHDNVSMCCH